MHIHTYLKGHVLPDASSDTCTCTKAHSDTSLHAQASPAARQTHACMHTDRTRVSAREYPQARSSAVCPLPAAQLRLAPGTQALPSPFHLPHWPQPRPQAPGWQLPHSPRCRLSQVSHPKVEPGQQGLLQPAWGISMGVAGGSQNPALVERGTARATQACPARLPASSSPSHPPSAGLRQPTSEMGQYVCPSDTSIKWTLHLQMMEFCLTFLCFIFTTTLRLYRCFSPLF